MLYPARSKKLLLIRASPEKSTVSTVPFLGGQIKRRYNMRHKPPWIRMNLTRYYRTFLYTPKHEFCSVGVLHKCHLIQTLTKSTYNKNSFEITIVRNCLYCGMCAINEKKAYNTYVHFMRSGA